MRSPTRARQPARLHALARAHARARTPARVHTSTCTRRHASNKTQKLATTPLTCQMPLNLQNNRCPFQRLTNNYSLIGLAYSVPGAKHCLVTQNQLRCIVSTKGKIKTNQNKTKDTTLTNNLCQSKPSNTKHKQTNT
jgi:hypothetical protein